MYIGSTDERGLHHLVWEVVDNSIDEAMAGQAKTITVTIKKDGIVIVQDDGRGVPVGKHSTGQGRARSRPHRPPFRRQVRRRRLQGVGRTARRRRQRRQRTLVMDARRIGARQVRLGAGVLARQGHDPGPEDRSSGYPSRHDDELSRRSRDVPDDRVSFELISQRLRESAYLTKRVWITFTDERNDRERSFYFEGGLQSFVRHLNRNKEVLHTRPIYVERREGSTAVEVALQYNDSYTENVLAFANNINTPDGGTHVTGFRAALTSSLNDWGAPGGCPARRRWQPVGDDVREGLTAVISVKLTDPQFEGQTKAKLGNAEVKGQVQTGRRRQPRPVSRREPGRRPPDYREMPDRGARA
jgi:DNA gyrase subunit B